MSILKKLYSEIGAWALFFLRGMPGSLGIRLRRFFYRQQLLRCGRGIIVLSGCVIRDSDNIEFGNNVSLGFANEVYASGTGNERIEIGDNFSSNSHVMINADRGGVITIGNNVLIGPNVVLRAANHRFDDATRPIREQGHTAGSITIEDDVWIGANSVILPNVIIGRGAIVAAGAVVTKGTVDAFSIIGGIPAKIIGRRN